MIPTVELIYDIDRKLNKLSNLENQSIPVEDKIIALNEARLALVKSKIGWNNAYTLGLDSFKKRYEDLQTLIEPYEPHALSLTLVDEQLNKWGTKLAQLQPEYMMYISSYVIADKGECKDRMLVVEKIKKHNEVFMALSNTNEKPSFEYQATFASISKDSLEIYTDGTFTPKNVYVSYLRYPAYMDVEGWEHLDGTPSTNVDCDLPYYLKDELINFTIKQLSEITENVPQVQISSQNIQKQE